MGLPGRSLIEWEAVNGRIITERLFSKPFLVYVIQCYAPTNEAKQQIKYNFYNILQQHGSPWITIRKKTDRPHMHQQEIQEIPPRCQSEKRSGHSCGPPPSNRNPQIKTQKVYKNSQKNQYAISSSSKTRTLEKQFHFSPSTCSTRCMNWKNNRKQWTRSSRT